MDGQAPPYGLYPDISSGAGGGAGGSVLIRTGVFSGEGTISANGGAGGSFNHYGLYGGGGGGGRIAVYFTDSSFSGSMQAFGGQNDLTYSYFCPGGPGIFLLPHFLFTGIYVLFTGTIYTMNTTSGYSMLTVDGGGFGQFGPPGPTISTTYSGAWLTDSALVYNFSEVVIKRQGTLAISNLTKSSVELQITNQLSGDATGFLYLFPNQKLTWTGQNISPVVLVHLNFSTNTSVTVPNDLIFPGTPLFLL